MRKLRSLGHCLLASRMSRGPTTLILANIGKVKQPVSRDVIYEHLQGVAPYGFYPLTGDKTYVGIADFDPGNPESAIELLLLTRESPASGLRYI